MGLGLPKDFRELLELLNANHFRYLLIGGYAVGYYGYSRFTEDIDFFVAADEDNARRLVLVLSEFGYSDGDLSLELFTRKDSLVIMGVEPMAVDILNYLTDVDFDDAYSRRQTIDDDGLNINIIGYDDLIRNKRAIGRHKDLSDIEYLERIRGTC